MDRTRPDLFFAAESGYSGRFMGLQRYRAYADQARVIAYRQAYVSCLARNDVARSSIPTDQADGLDAVFY
jgi:hypothetical protein